VPLPCTINRKMRAMHYLDGHPNVSLPHWRTFCEGFPQYRFTQVIDRCELGLDDNVLPLARGGVIASDAWPRSIGYSPRQGHPRGWSRVLPGVWELMLNEQHCLHVRRIGELWMVGRCEGTPLIDFLVFHFGSTPVLTRDCRSAKYLAWYYSMNELPCDLRWVRAVPENCENAVELARQTLCTTLLNQNKPH
jgi:hypothetical protein